MQLDAFCMHADAVTVMVYVKLASEIQLLKFQLNFSEISIADPELLEICKLEVRVVTL